MKIQQYHCLLQATFSSPLLLLLSITATYAIASAPQAEVSVPPTQIAPRPLKFGEKLAQNEVYQPTPLVTQQLGNSENAAQRQGRRESARGRNNVQNNRDPQNSIRRQPENRGSPQPTSSANDNFLPTPLVQNTQRKESRSRSGTRRQPEPEYISLPTHAPPETSSHLARRHNAASSRQNQLVGPHYEIPAVQKIPETAIYKTVNPVVGGQQPAPPQPQQPAAIAANSNRSRFAQTIVEPPNRSHELNYQQQQQQQQQHQLQLVTAVATTKRSKSSSPSRTNSHKNSQHAASPSTTTTTSRNSNHNASSRSSNSNRNHNEVNKPSSVPRVPVTAPSDERRRAPTKIVTTTAANGQLSQKNASANHSGRSTPPNNARKSSSSSSSSSTATTTTPRSLFSLPNEYNIFSPAFWSFLNPTTRATHSSSTSRTRTASSGATTTKKPPKKYIPPQQIPTKEEKLNYSKAKPAFQPTKEIATTTTTPSPPYQVPSEYTNDIGPPNRKEEGPFRIALPTFNILGQRRNTGDGSPSDKDKRNVDDDDADLRAKFNCPRESEVRFQLFPKICKIDDDCRVWNRGEICCEIFGAKSCVSGIPKPLEETSHSPILGLIARKCPDRPLAELWWEVKECETDMDCWPRVCCPDGRRRYCRTSQPELNTVPVPVQRSFNYLTEYLECTAPPPPIFDLHPKACTSTLDCFPNVCCQEAGLRHCRPPKKSVLTMLANVFNVDLVKRLTQNIVIK